MTSLHYKTFGFKRDFTVCMTDDATKDPTHSLSTSSSSASTIRRNFKSRRSRSTPEHEPSRTSRVQHKREQVAKVLNCGNATLLHLLRFLVVVLLVWVSITYCHCTHLGRSRSFKESHPLLLCIYSIFYDNTNIHNIYI